MMSQNQSIGTTLDQTSRGAMAVGAVVCGLIAFGLGWAVRKFLNGNEWYDLIVSWILFDFVLSVGLLSLLLLIGALFAPAWLTRALATASDKLLFGIGAYALLLGGTMIVSMVAVPILFWLGVLP